MTSSPSGKSQTLLLLLITVVNDNKINDNIIGDLQALRGCFESSELGLIASTFHYGTEANAVKLTASEYYDTFTDYGTYRNLIIRCT